MLFRSPYPLATPQLEIAAHGFALLAAQPSGEADWQAAWQAAERVLAAPPPTEASTAAGATVSDEIADNTPGEIVDDGPPQD